MEVKTGLWKKTSKDGKTNYYFGQRDGVKVTLFKNEKREGKDNDPDLNVIIDIEDAGGGSDATAPLDGDDDIPFS